jgi:hypothetical protein
MALISPASASPLTGGLTGLVTCVVAEGRHPRSHEFDGRWETVEGCFSTGGLRLNAGMKSSSKRVKTPEAVSLDSACSSPSGSKSSSRNSTTKPV